MPNSDDHGHHHHHQGPSIAHGEPAPACPIHDGPADHALSTRSAAIKRVFWITLVFNLAVAAAKAAYALASGSVTLGADAFHSILDGSANVLALVGMHLSAAPASARHPYGRRKIEVLAAVGIGVLIVIGLFEVATAAVQALLGQRQQPHIGWIGFAVVLASMSINWFVARYEHRKGSELRSSLLSADAHHTESDIYASGAVLLSFIGTRFGLWWADGVCGLLVVLMVGWVAWLVFRANVPMLLDAAVLDPAHVRSLASAIPGVHGIHRVRSRGTPWAFELDLHMAVAADMKVADAHAVAERVEAELRAKLPELRDVVVHIEPVIRADPQENPE